MRECLVVPPIQAPSTFASQEMDAFIAAILERAETRGEATGEEVRALRARLPQTSYASLESGIFRGVRAALLSDDADFGV